MIVFIFKLIFFAINALSNLISRLIFTTSAYLLVIIIQAFRVPGQAAHGALQQIAKALKTCFEHLLEIVMEAVSALLSSAFDIVIGAVTGSAAGAGSAIGGLIEKTRTSLDGFFKENLTELAQEFSEMISTMVNDLWNNYKEAVGYVTENA